MSKLPNFSNAIEVYKILTAEGYMTQSNQYDITQFASEHEAIKHLLNKFAELSPNKAINIHSYRDLLYYVALAGLSEERFCISYSYKKSLSQAATESPLIHIIEDGLIKSIESIATQLPLPLFSNSAVMLNAIKYFTPNNLFNHLIYYGKKPEYRANMQNLSFNLNEDNRLFEKITCTADTESQKNNIKILTSSNNTPWVKAFADLGVALPILTTTGLVKLLPHGTIVLSKTMGGPIIHIYYLDKFFIAAIYAGYTASLYEVQFHFTDHTDIILARTPVHQRDGFHSALYDQSRVFAKAIASYINLPITADATIKSKIKNNCALILAHKINYGHTVINESSALSACLEIANNKTVDIVIGDYDYFNYENLLTTQAANRDKLNIRKLSDISTKLQLDFSAYALKNLTLIPLSTYRPIRAGLEILKYPYIKTHTQVTNNYKSIYISLDNRPGNRSCLNKKDIILSSLQALKNLGHSELYLDGITYFRAIENYRAIPKIHCNDLSISDIEYIKSTAKAYNIKLTIIDSLIFLDKMQHLGNSPPKLAIAPYGSSMILPIYLLNTNTFVYGWERFANVLKQWEWHVDKFCHSDRHQTLNYLNSTSRSEDGYYVDTNELIKKIHHCLTSTNF